MKKPIKRGALILSPEGDKVWIAFQYERLVGLCFNYGLIGHEARECHHPLSNTEEEKPYGEWLRAGSRGVKDPRGKKQASPPQRKAEKANERVRDQPQPPQDQQMAEANGTEAVRGTVTREELIVTDSTKKGVTASAENHNSVDHTLNYSDMVMGNAEGEHETEILGGSLVIVPVTCLEKNNE